MREYVLIRKWLLEESNMKNYLTESDLRQY